MVKGLEKLKIDGSSKADLDVEIMKKEQKLILQSVNYKKNHELYLSLHSEAKFRIVLHVNVLQLHLTYPARQSTDSNNTYEIDNGPDDDSHGIVQRSTLDEYTSGIVSGRYSGCTGKVITTPEFKRGNIE